MGKDNERPRNRWGEDDETEFSGSFRDPYRNTVNRNRARPRSNNFPSDDVPETPSRSGGRTRSGSGPGGGRIYEEGNERPTRPRPTRQSRDEVYSRLRQRPHQPIYSRNQEPSDARPPTRTQKTEPRRERTSNSPYQPPTFRRERGDTSSNQQPIPARTQRTSSQGIPANPGYRKSQEYEEYHEYDTYDEYQIVQQRRRPPARPLPQRKHGRGGRIVSNILIGCLGGLITLALVAGVIAYVLLTKTPLGHNLGTSNYTQQVNQTLTLGSATQLIIKNQVGNVAISVDQNASNATLASTKKVQTGSQNEANSLFNQITLTTKSINQGNDPSCLASTCLLIIATVPSTNGGSLFSNGNGATIDLAITLPASFSNPSSPYTITASTTSGDLTVNGFNGILNLSGSIGNVNISVTHSLVFPGTCLQTTDGDINVNQSSIFDLGQPPHSTPCTNNPSSSGDPWFHISGGKGNVNVTLMASYSHLQLQATTNNGKITDEFGLNILTPGDGSASYNGPLLVGTNPSSTDPLIYLSTSTGDIKIQKQ